jgi:hypothetical protein
MFVEDFKVKRALPQDDPCCLQKPTRLFRRFHDPVI